MISKISYIGASLHGNNIIVTDVLLSSIWLLKQQISECNEKHSLFFVLDKLILLYCIEQLVVNAQCMYILHVMMLLHLQLLYSLPDIILSLKHHVHSMQYHPSAALHLLALAQLRTVK